MNREEIAHRMNQISSQALRAKLALLYLSQVIPNTPLINIEQKRIEQLLEAIGAIDDVIQSIRNYEAN
jgi:hypothetical protein